MHWSSVHFPCRLASVAAIWVAALRDITILACSCSRDRPGRWEDVTLMTGNHPAPGGPGLPSPVITSAP